MWYIITNTKIANSECFAFVFIVYSLYLQSKGHVRQTRDSPLLVHSGCFLDVQITCFPTCFSSNTLVLHRLYEVYQPNIIGASWVLKCFMWNWFSKICVAQLANERMSKWMRAWVSEWMNESADERITPFYRSVHSFYNCSIIVELFIHTEWIIRMNVLTCSWKAVNRCRYALLYLNPLLYILGFPVNIWLRPSLFPNLYK